MEMRCYHKILHISKIMLPTRKSVPRFSRQLDHTKTSPPDDRKETQTAVVWSCLPFIRSGQNHFARHSERGKKTRQTEVEVGRQHRGMDRPGVHQVPEGSGEQGNMEKTGCEIICAPTTLAVKGQMMMVNCTALRDQLTTRRDTDSSAHLVKRSKHFAPREFELRVRSARPKSVLPLFSKTTRPLALLTLQ